MKLLLYRFIFLFLPIIFLVSCYENNINEIGNPVITSLSNSKIFRGEELTIYGQNLREFPDSAAIFIDSFKVADVKSKNITKWNNSFITIKTDTNFRSGKLYLIINKDTTNKLLLTLDTMPNILMVTVDPIATFKMGSDLGSDDELPIHSISITKKLQVSTYEVTQSLWSLVMKNNPSDFKGDSLPVVNVNWDMAIQFCNEFSKIKNYLTCYSKDTSGKWQWVRDSGGYRLPTEAEWEYFARAKAENDYSGTGNVNDMGWYELNSGFNIHQVGLKGINAFGLYDVHGNAREWCWDFYDIAFYNNPEIKNDPTGPANGTSHVSRGGSAADASKFLRLTNRSYKDTLINFQGFRIVRNIK